MRILLKAAAIAVCALITINSCSDSDNVDYSTTVDLKNSAISYDSITGAWTGVYDPECDNDLLYALFRFSHHGESGEYGDYYYGFCPTISDDNENHPDDWVPNHQWGAITGISSYNENRPYMIAYWDAYQDSQAENGTGYSCKISCNRRFTPERIFVTNATYTYYAMQDGTSFSKAFDDDDYLLLNIHGMLNGEVTNTIPVYLAKDGKPVGNWLRVELKQLGEVDAIYFSMESSDVSEYGINTPTYFCIDALTVNMQTAN